jgi:alginate O-acetyltransferase complex protein AlgI
VIISFNFFGLLAGGAIIYWLLPKNSIRILFLTLISFVFIWLNDKNALFLVLVLSVYSYLFGILIEKKIRIKLIFPISIFGLLAILTIFKYIGLLANTINYFNQFISILPVIKIEALLMPLGISYIVLKHISYLTDIKWGLCKKGKFIDFLCYSSLFTIFTAGPIERFERFKPQAENSELNFSTAFIEEGCLRIVLGLFKKLVIADLIGYLIKPIWHSPEGTYSVWINLAGLIGFSIQIFADFDGYSDIAIGSSRLFGFKIMENFGRPYLQPNISQFWRHWHISLSDWIRDYLFFPLSNLKFGLYWQIIAVPIIAMALCGLWHGADWKFLLWGVLHGVAISIFQFWQRMKRKRIALQTFSDTKFFYYFSVLITFSFVTFSWLFFK